MDFPFDDLPRYWFRNNPMATHAINGLHLLFPAGERFFVRSVNRYLPKLEDEELVRQAKLFFGQEGSHAREHQAVFEVLEAQGYDIKGMLSRYEHLAYKRVEPMTSELLRLSVTAALEHYTATLAHEALSREFLEEAHPQMAALLRWHAAEEIEHKSVAFDVLQAVDPRWSTRALGLVVGTAVLSAFWMQTMAAFVQEDPNYGWGGALRDYVQMVRSRFLMRGTLRRAFVDYLRPDFHPDQRDDYQLAEDYLSSIGREDH